MRVRRRIIAFIFFPAIVFLWVLGLGLYWLEAKSGPRRTIQSIDDGISIVTKSYEEAVIIQD